MAAASAAAARLQEATAPGASPVVEPPRPPAPAPAPPKPRLGLAGAAAPALLTALLGAGALLDLAVLGGSAAAVGGGELGAGGALGALGAGGGGGRAFRRAEAGSSAGGAGAAAEVAVDGAGGAARKLQLLSGSGLGAVDEEEDGRKGSGGPRKMTFYLYRAQGDDDYPLENVNAADLPGLMWYLHNEVVGSVPRKFHITRILRYKITMRSRPQLVKARNSNFGPFVAFDSGRCTVPDCDKIWDEFGYNLGCQPLDTSEVVYESPFLTHLAPHTDHHAGLWYSLPGPCPSSTHEDKSDACRAHRPGGRCPSLEALGRPDSECTYFAEPAGEVRLDEVAGIEDYERFWVVERKKEYVWSLDKGVGNDFWDGRKDPVKCTERMDKVQELFKRKHPDLPMTFGEPPCDA